MHFYICIVAPHYYIMEITSVFPPPPPIPNNPPLWVYMVVAPKCFECDDKATKKMFIFCLHDNLCVLSDVAVVWSICLVQAGAEIDRRMTLSENIKFEIFKNTKGIVWESSWVFWWWWAIMQYMHSLKMLYFLYIFLSILLKIVIREE